MTVVGPVPEEPLVQLPPGALFTRVLTTLKPLGTTMVTQPMSWSPAVTVSVTSVGTPTVSVDGASVIDHG